jgi:ABC-2 type transport system permease protein
VNEAGKEGRPTAVRAYLGLFRMRLIRGLSYRAAAFAGIATQFFFGLVFMSVFQAFARASGSAPLSQGQISTYIWLQQAFLALSAVWIRDGGLIALIQGGDAAYELCRPLDVYPFWFARTAAQRLASAALRCLPILAVAVFLPRPFRLGPPASWEAGLLFIPALALGLLVTTALSMFAYALTVATLSANAAFFFYAPIAEMGSGNAIPLPFMPDWLSAALSWLPFRFCADFPYRIYCGSIPIRDAPGIFAIGAAWFLILAFLGRAALGAALSRARQPGG